MRGRPLERKPDEEFAEMDTISRKYTRTPILWRNPEGRIILVIEVDRAR